MTHNFKVGERARRPGSAAHVIGGVIGDRVRFACESVWRLADTVVRTDQDHEYRCSRVACRRAACVAGLPDAE